MRAKLDENLPIEVAELLRAAGWECDTVYDEGLAGADDPNVAAACRADARVLPVLSAEWVEHRLWIVEPARVRVRSENEPAV
jgi:predicted nuclease of predicted toxin-antitoxin system